MVKWVIIAGILAMGVCLVVLGAALIVGKRAGAWDFDDPTEGPGPST